MPVDHWGYLRLFVLVEFGSSSRAAILAHIYPERRQHTRRYHRFQHVAASEARAAGGGQQRAWVRAGARRAARFLVTAVCM